MNIEETNNTTDKILTRDFLLECFECDEEKGVLIWKDRPLHHFKSLKSCNSK